MTIWVRIRIMIRIVSMMMGGVHLPACTVVGLAQQNCGPNRPRATFLKREEQEGVQLG
jgi:hypothetical protein